MLMIGICGASGSGKTTLALALSKRIRDRVVLLNQDTYYLDHADKPFAERAAMNFDEPSSFDHDALYADLCALKRGERITSKGYDFTEHRRNDPGTVIEPQNVGILEGIHAFYEERVRELMDLKIYVRVDPDVCLIRRVKRDIQDRGRDIAGITKQYLTSVKPMYEQYVRGYIRYADLIVAGGGENQRVVDMLSCYIDHEILPGSQT